MKLVIKQVTDVVLRAGKEVIDTDHLVTLTQQPVTEMRAQKSGATRNHNSSGHQMTPFILETYRRVGALPAYANSSIGT